MTPEYSVEFTTIINDLIIRTRPPQAELYLDRLRQGALTRDENPLTHFSTYFAAIDPTRRKVFIGHHKKADLWLFNGGHIDRGELPTTTVRREMLEEWGYDPVPHLQLKPELLTITTIEHDPRPCRTHFDIWYFIPVDQKTFHPDPLLLSTEFHQNRWLPLNEARLVASRPIYRSAFELIQNNYFI